MTFQEFKKNFQNRDVKEISLSPVQNPLVSVLVQTYQQKDYIRESLEGILMQETSFDFEILLGEDGSLDGTREICQEFAENYPDKIRLFLHQRENQIKVMGEATPNFNAFYNFYSARGKYIAFCEGDDIWSDHKKLQKQVNFLNENPDYVFTYHSYISIDKNGKRIPSPEEEFQPTYDLSIEDLLTIKYHPLLFTICYRNVIKKIPHEMAEVLNVDSFLYSLLGEFGGAKYLDDIVPAKYRKHTGGIWSERKAQKKFQSKIITFRKLVKFYERTNKLQLVSFFNKKLKGSIKMLIASHLKTGDVLQAMKLSKSLISKN